MAGAEARRPQAATRALSRSRRAATAVLIALLAGTALAAATGCRRRPQLVPAGADSTAVPSDSFAIRARDVQQLWDDPQSGADAARLSADLVQTDLTVHPDEPWPSRVRALLDSLDFGAEVAADRRVVAVNFFSRSHPEGGSWPWLFWPASSGVRALALAGQGLQLQQVASRPGPGGGTAAVAVLFGRRVSSGEEPLLMVWNDLARAATEPSQTLGPDSLGGVGTGSFGTADDSSVTLETRTFRAIPHFQECATCPHVFTVRRFQWDGPVFRKHEEHAIPSPYSSFVAFVNALVANDQAGALRYALFPAVLDDAKRYGMDMPARGAWRVAPATDETARQMVFFRGQTEAYTVSFEPRGDDWAVASIIPTTRTVE